MRILLGKAHLEIHPTGWLDPRLGDPEDQAAAIVRALWSAHPCITSVTVGHDWPAVNVEIALPAEGKLHLPELQQTFARRCRNALAPTHRRSSHTTH